MASLADVTITLGIDDSGVTKKIKDTENNIDKLFNTLKKALAGIAIGNLITTTMKLNAEIVNTAKALNISTESAIAFQKATAAAGGDADNARDALISLSQKLGEAATSGGDALAAFNEMGLGLADINKNSPEQMLIKTLKAMNELSDSTQRESIRTRLFGEDFKNANLPEVIKNMEELSGKAKQLAPSYIAARNAQLQFNKSFADFQDQVTQNIPWDTLTQSLKSISANLETITGITKGALEIGAAFLFVSKVMIPLRGVIAGVEAGASKFGGVLSAISTYVKGTFAAVGMAFEDIFAVFTGSGPLLARFGTTLAGIFGFGGKVAILYAIADGLNSIIKIITGFDAFDKIDTLTQKLAQLFNIPYQTEKHKEIYKIAVEQAKEEAALEELKKKNIDGSNDSRGKTSKILDDQKKSLAQIYSQYRTQNEQALSKLELDNKLVGAGEDQKRLSTEIMNIENQRQQVVQGLYDKIFETTDPTLMKGYSDAIQQVNKDFEDQKSQVAGLLETQAIKLQQDRLDNFNTEQRISRTQRLRDLDNERSKIFLPLIEQKYKDIEDAATSAITAQMEAEAKARGLSSPSDLPLEYTNKIAESVRKNIELEKEKTKAIEDTNIAKLKETFSDNTLLENQKQLRDIQNEIAYSTMPAYEQISAKLTNGAKEKAIAEINAENARRGSKMSAAEEQQYYDAANKGLSELIAKQEESYKVSRQWDTGWTKAINDYIENATNAAKVAENVFSKAMSGMEDMFVNFVKTGKFEWKSFVNSMLEELLRAQFQSTMAKALGGITGNNTGSNSGSILGGLFNSFSGMFANGGSIASGNWGIVGEAGPEIVQGPANITPMKNISSSSSIVNYNINAVDAMSFKQMIARDPSFIHAVAMQGAKSIPGVR